VSEEQTVNEDTGPDGREPLAFGVPAGTLVGALRGAGLAEPDVIALVGRAIARSAGMTAELTETPAFVFQTQIAETAPECALTFDRGFVHPDFIDGVTVVQAGTTPEEMGFNQRFHAIENDLDNIAHDLHTASNCTAELRRELFGLAQELQAKITEIDSRLDAKTKDKEKDTKESKDKDTKEGKETKEKDTKESKDKEGKDTKDTKEKDTKEKDTKEKEEKERAKDDQKEFLDIAGPLPAGSATAEPSDEGGTGGGTEGAERTFIRLEDRPDVGAAALADPGEDEPEETRDGTPEGGGA
jgi:hypothetical protein